MYIFESLNCASGRVSDWSALLKSKITFVNSVAQSETSDSD